MRTKVRGVFADRIRGQVEAHQDERLLTLLERRPTCLPSGFRHEVITRSTTTAMLSGVLYGDGIATWDRAAAGDRRTTTALDAAPLDASALKRLYGDYSVAIWDRSSRELMLFSSFMGVMPLFYAQIDATVLWSSSLGTLRDLLGSRAIDRPYLIAFLTLQRLVGRTSYAAIHTLPPGATLVCRPTASGVSTTVLDSLTIADTDLVLRDEREYAERMYAVVTEAVASRMPDTGTFYVESSGGMDSSTIALAAGRARRGDGDLRALHYTSGSSPEWDETRYARLVGRCANLETDIVDLDETPFIDLGDGVALEHAASHTRQTAKRVRSRGGEVILSGRAGDLVFGNTKDNSLSALEYLRRKELMAFGSCVIDWSISANQPAIVVLGHMLLASFLPRVYGRRLERHKQEHRTAAVATSGRQHVAEHSLRPSALRELKPHRANVNALAARFVHTSKRQMLAGVLVNSQYRRLENSSNDALVLYPYADHRFIDFVLSIPQELHCKPGQPRYLMRQSFADLWPPELRRRFSKAHATPVTLRLFKPYGESLSRQRHFALADLNVLDVDSLRKRLAVYTSGAGLRIGNLKRIWQAEEWLRRLNGQPSLFGNRDAAIPIGSALQSETTHERR